ncbi:hypothetical protein MUK42_32827 [Musa troglodytarum]|uniref:Uncharacterized protein n=1 Tax=Musa troglodytarum TaxID=320322 RepID=A0A9E7JTG4_9LILI|nr:hypothetical protein MUK42_32827 [Musa troglodytarum]
MGSELMIKRSTHPLPQKKHCHNVHKSSESTMMRSRHHLLRKKKQHHKGSSDRIPSWRFVNKRPSHRWAAMPDSSSHRLSWAKAAGSGGQRSVAFTEAEEEDATSRLGLPRIEEREAGVRGRGEEGDRCRTIHEQRNPEKAFRSQPPPASHLLEQQQQQLELERWSSLNYRIGAHPERKSSIDLDARNLCT